MANLFEHWDATKGALVDGLDGNKRAVMETVLENVKRELMEAASKKMNIQIMKQTVEARSRKLSARWTFKAAQDANSQHGIDVEAEIMAALAQQITTEIDQEILLALEHNYLSGVEKVVSGYRWDGCIRNCPLPLYNTRFIDGIANRECDRDWKQSLANVRRTQ